MRTCAVALVLLLPAVTLAQQSDKDLLEDLEQNRAEILEVDGMCRSPPPRPMPPDIVEICRISRAYAELIRVLDASKQMAERMRKLNDARVGTELEVDAARRAGDRGRLAAALNRREALEAEVAALRAETMAAAFEMASRLAAIGRLAPGRQGVR